MLKKFLPSQTGVWIFILWPAFIIGQKTGTPLSFQDPKYSEASQVEDSDRVSIARMTKAFLEDHGAGDDFLALQKIQEAMILERRLTAPSEEAFHFNLYAGVVVASIDYQYAMAFYKKATQLAQRGITANPSDVFTLFSNRAGLHALLMEFDSAQYFYRKAIEVSMKDSRDAEISGHNNLGVFYFQRMQYDSASICFTKALTLMGDRREAIGLYCAIRDNLAQLDVIGQRYESALSTFVYNDSVYTARKLYNKYLGNKQRQIEVMKHLNKPGIAVELANGIHHIKRHSADIPVKDVISFLRLAIDEYKTNGAHGKSKDVLEFYYQWTDSIQQVNTRQLHFLNSSLLKVQEASFQNALQVKQLEADKAKIRLRSARRITWLSILAGAMISILLMLYFKIRRQELLAQKLITETALRTKVIEGQLLQQELQLKQKDLTNLVLHNTQVYDANQKMIDRLQTITKSNEDPAAQIRHLLIELQSQNQIGERAITLQSEIEVLNAAFYAHLRQRFPDLTKAEEELCGYLRIDLTTKDIAILKNVEAASVKMAKNRLRKKLGLGAEVDLYGFVKDI